MLKALKDLAAGVAPARHHTERGGDCTRQPFETACPRFVCRAVGELLLVFVVVFFFLDLNLTELRDSTSVASAFQKVSPSLVTTDFTPVQQDLAYLLVRHTRAEREAEARERLRPVLRRRAPRPARPRAAWHGPAPRGLDPGTSE